MRTIHDVMFQMSQTAGGRFYFTSNGAGEPQGLCLTCAKELGIKPVNDLLDKMGLNEEQLDSMETELGQLMNPDGDGEEGEETSPFSPGGACDLPNFLQSIFPGMGKPPQEGQPDQPPQEPVQKSKSRNRSRSAAISIRIARISPPKRLRARSTPSSAVTARLAAWCRF